MKFLFGGKLKLQTKRQVLYYTKSIYICRLPAMDPFKPILPPCIIIDGQMDIGRVIQNMWFYIRS